MADIVLISPKFEASFWGLEHAMPILGKRATMPAAALPLLAALTPAGHEITLIDENVEAIDFERCARADIVGVTGMVVQRARMREILAELKRRGAYTVVGGAWVSVQEDYFGDLADVIFVGEAEETWPSFLEDWQSGKPQSRYEQAEKTDMTRVPAPRLDLLKMNRYAFGSMQFSRGCPFLCEFCDIIVTFGRKPRFKSIPQIIAELDMYRSLGTEFLFIVDDNIIGNKRVIKDILPAVIEWQRRNAFPIAFFTQATLDLADDDELMRLMTDALFATVFVGIESPNPDSLRETRKMQNVRPGGSMVEKVRRIQDAGMEVSAGMILGFDHDDETIFDAHHDFVTSARIHSTMLGMLSAIPKTPLYARLVAAGRLDPADESPYGTNVVPLKMSRDELSRGYTSLMSRLYAPTAYFERLDDLFVTGGIRCDRAWQRYAGRHPWKRRVRHFRYWVEAFLLIARLLSRVPDASLRRIYWSQFFRYVRVGGGAALSRVYAIKCVMHYHWYEMARSTAHSRVIVNTF
jgi:radical SAM superfamily enzyme YgiQ (UPF0313 family)